MAARTPAEQEAASEEAIRGYLFDMLAQLAAMAVDCGEHDVAALLRLVTKSRGVDRLTTRSV